MNILHIDSSARGDASASRQLTARAVNFQDVTIVRAEGTGTGEQARQTAMQGALQQMARLRAA